MRLFVPACIEMVFSMKVTWLSMLDSDRLLAG